MVCNENKTKTFTVNEAGPLRVKKRRGSTVGGVISVELLSWEPVEDIDTIEFPSEFLITWTSRNWF